MTGLWAVLITTFLASAVEAIEMVTIVVGVGATRGWRSTLIGAASGFGVLAMVVVVLGAALSQVPIGPLRLIVGALLLTFGLQWFRKGIMRVAAAGLGTMLEPSGGRGGGVGGRMHRSGPAVAPTPVGLSPAARATGAGGARGVRRPGSGALRWGVGRPTRGAGVGAGRLALFVL